MMKSLFIFISLTLLLTACQEPVTNNTLSAISQEPKSSLPVVDTSIFETFSYQEGDTTYLMKKYFMVHLKTGPNRDQDKEEAARIQTAHQAHLEQLHKEQKICIAGPFEGNAEMQGLVVFSVPNLEIADSLANADPAVQAGRLTVEVIPFWAAVGSQLF